MKFKRTIAALLAFGVLFSQAPMPVFASDSAQDAVIEYTGDTGSGAEGTTAEDAVITDSTGDVPADGNTAPSDSEGSGSTAEDPSDVSPTPDVTPSPDRQDGDSAADSASSANEPDETDETDKQAELQTRINALPGLEAWEALCEAQNAEYTRVIAEVEQLCQDILAAYGLDLRAESFDPTQDYSALCPLNLTKLLAILYPDNALTDAVQREVDSNVVYVGVEHGYVSESDVMGATPEHPYPTLQEAYDAVPDGGTIFIVDTLTVDTWPTNAKNVTIEGYKDTVQVPVYDSNNALIGYEEETYTPTLTMSGSWVLHGDTVFQDMTLVAAAPTGCAIFPDGHRLQIGSGRAAGTAGQGGVIPRENDVVVQQNNSLGYLSIATEPSTETADASITKVDIHLYGDNYYNVWSCPRGTNNRDPHTGANDILTPNLQTVTIEMIGSPNCGLTQRGNHWYNSMLPPFSGAALQNVSFTLGYMKIPSTEALFRSGSDGKNRPGSYSVHYLFDHIPGAVGEAISYGEICTTGNVTLDLYDCSITGSQTCLTPGTFGMKAGDVTINLHDTSLNRTGVVWSIRDGRNGSLDFSSMTYNLYGTSKITDRMMVQDNTIVNLYDSAEINAIVYEGKEGADTLNLHAYGVQTVPQNFSTGNAYAALTVHKGAVVMIPAGCQMLKSVENDGTLYVGGTVSVYGDYTGDAGTMYLVPKAVVRIDGAVTGTTSLKLYGDLQKGERVSVVAGSGAAESMIWTDIDAETTTTARDGYWSAEKYGEDHAVSGCIYLRYGGDDENDGTSVQKAVGTIQRAYELAKADQKKIVLIDTYYPASDNLSSFGAEGERTDSPIVLTSNDGEIDFAEENDAALVAMSSTNNGSPAAMGYGLTLTSAFQFENITITTPNSAGRYSIYCNGYNTVMGENVTLTGYPTLLGGGYDDSSERTSTNLVVNSGSYIAIYGGNYKSGRSLHSINLVVNGCTMVNYTGTLSDFSGVIAGGCIYNYGGIYLGSSSAPCTVNVTVCPAADGSITGVKRVAAGNVYLSTACNEVYAYANYHLKVDGISVEAITGAEYNARPTYSQLGSYSTEMEIGKTQTVTTNTLCVGSLSRTSGQTWTPTIAPTSAKLTLGYVLVSGKLDGGDSVGYVAGQENAELVVQANGISAVVGAVDGFDKVTIGQSAYLELSNTKLGTNAFENNGILKVNAADTVLSGTYAAGSDAAIQLGSGSKLHIAGEVTGTTTISGQTGRAFYVYAPQNTTEDHFTGDKITYDNETDDTAVWYYDPFAGANRSYVYLDGTNGDDSYDGQQPVKGETVSDGEQSYTPGPVKTLEHAYDLLKKSGGSIILCGETTITSWPANSTKTVLLTADASLVEGANDPTSYRADAKLWFTPTEGDSRFMAMQGDLTIQRLDIRYAYPKDGEYGGLDANGHALYIGEEGQKKSVTFYEKGTNSNFMVVGGGASRTTVEQIDLKLYGLSLGFVAVVYGGTSKATETVVNGPVNAVVSDCTISNLSSGYAALYICSFGERLTGSPDTSAYATIKGDVSLYSGGENSYQYFGFYRVVNEGKLDMTYRNNGNSRDVFNFYGPYQERFMQRSSKETSITFDGKFQLDYFTLCGSDEFSSDSKVTIDFFGDILFSGSAHTGNLGSTGVDLTLNFGSPDRTCTVTSNYANIGALSLLPENNQKFKSIVFNCYGESASQLFCTDATLCEDGTKPIINLYGTESCKEIEVDACTQWNNIAVTADGMKITQTADGTLGVFDLTLKNGASFVYPFDGMELSGSLNMDGADAKLDAVDNYEISGDVSLTNGASLNVETTLTVGGQFSAEEGCAITMEPDANAVLNSVADDSLCSVIYNGKAADAERSGISIRSVSETEGRHFTDAATSDEQTIVKRFEDNTWYYGTQENTGDIYLRSNGDDTYDGTTAAKSVATLKRALEIAADSEETGKNIVLCGRYTFENTDSNQISNEVLEKLKTKQITITQKNSGSTTYHGVLTVNSGFQIPCALRLQTITLNFHADTQAAPELYACGFGLIVDEAVTVKSNTIAPVLYGGAKDTDCENTNLYVYSGTWSRIYGGGKNGAVLGNACITLGSSEKQIAPSVWAGSEDSNYTSNTYAVIGGGQYGNVAGASTINLNYGTEYNYVIGGGVNGDSASTCINVNNEEVSAARLYGGGVNGSVTGNAEVNVLGGSFKRVYGAGIMQSSSVGSTAVTIGKGKTTVTQFIRGSGDRGKVDGTASLTINDGAEIPSSCSLAAGGYMGGAACSVLTINGGNIACNSFAGGYGEFKAGSTTEINTDVGYVSASKLYINGGTISGNLFAGGNMGYVGSGKHQNTDCSTVQISGGRVDGNIYGGCNIAATYGNVVLNLKGGTVNGKVFGGGKGSTSIGAVVTGSTEVIVDAPVATGGIYGGCDANGSVENTKLECNTIPGCDVFGGGYGEQTSVTGSTAITLNASDASNDYAVYGGGELGKVNTTEITAQKWTGNIYGGGSKAETTSTASVTVNGTVDGSVFGGGKGALKSESTVMRFLLRVFTDGDLIDAHTVSTNVTVAGTVNGDVFGGGEYATVGDGGDASVTSVAICGTVNGRVYGGGKGEAGKSYAAINGSTLVTLEKNGSVLENAELAGTGMVFGGGQNAPVNGSTQVQVHDGAYTSVFGGNDASGAISGMAQAAMSGGEVTQIYAAGQKADAKTAAVTVTGGTAQLVYGGGNEATVTDETKVTVTGGKVDTVFAGNNRAAMAIQPTLELAGHINAVYCGGNEGVMTAPLQYTFDFPDVEIDELFAGCNNTGEIQTSDTVLTLVSGSYSSVYGGNNQTGNMLHTSVVVEESEENALTIQELYGGGNCADAVNTKVTVNAYAEKSGKTFTVYGGGNEATVSDSVQLVLGDESHQKTPQVDAMFCGNNAAEMAIIPALQLESGEIKEFYGGGNKGAMTGDDGVAYTFDSDGLTIDTIYGGGNEAGVTNGVVLNIAKGNYTDIYGGSNEKGTVSTVAVNIRGDVGTESKTGAVFGGGHGEDTVVQDAAVNLLSGTINGNVYGGSGYGSVENTVVTAEPDSDGAVVVLGNVYGAGYGETSAVTNASVVIDLPLSISTQTGEGNLTVTETAKSVESVSGESHASAKWNEAAGSYISGSVFGGGDMGQVGSGHINASSNTAVIDTTGSTSVQVRSGDIKGSVFGGGNGQPASGTVYTLYMGTVFGSSEVQITGGYIEGSIFGCGQQSRTYSAENGIASNVGITAVDGKPVVIGGSVFGGGNKGNGSNQNASVATVYGDTHVKLSGEAGKYTQIYMLSTESSGGGIYGDGNLCLVSGKKYVELENFSCGVRTDLLKTFYSLQRADVVTLKGSRVVLLGAVDLVADQADDTQYSVNRVGQLNLKDSSTIKVTKTVNLLSELTSDEQPDRQFVDRGNNTGNAGISGNDYTGHGGSAPKAPLTAEENQAYIADYQAYIEGKSLPNDTFRSINVVCVANGGYLEVKKSAEEYGAVTGLFTLQLVNANPGEGGGFVYASIQGKQSGDDYITGNFVCVTPDSSGNGFMTVFHDVGGSYDEGKYEYYLWYLKGNKYSYDVNLTGYIGTQDTEFEKTLSVSADRDQYYVLLDLERSRTVTGFEDSMLQNVWTGSDADRTSSRIAIEVQLLTNERSGSGIDTNTQNIGFIGYQTEDNTPDGTASLDENGQRVWGIWRSVNNAWSFQPCKGDKNSFAVTAADALAKLDENVVGAQLKFILHKGTGMTTEFRNLPFELKIAEVAKSDFEGPNKIQTDSCILLTANLNVSAIRLVPSQAAYLGAGKLYGGVSSDSVVNITDESAFTMQFITKYIPSAFGTSSADAIQETLCTSYDTIYLVDANGVGYTLDAKSEALTPTYVTNQNDNTVQGYTIAESNGAYTVTYLDASGSALTDEDGNVRSYSCTAIRQSSGFELPAGTTITLIASIDEATPSYWYYYCEKSTGEVPLGEFTMMNRSENSTGDSIYDVISSNSSSRITENMIFVLDFSNVPERNWPSVTEGTAILSHTYRTGSQSYADIMDFVSEETLQNGGTAYTHEAAKETGEFRINRATDGIDQFSVLRDDAQESDDALTFDLIITPDNTATNTRYEERQYAVILSLQDKNGTQIAFPEGTEFMYQGEQLHLGAGNDYVIVPVGTVGTHTVRMRTTLETLAAGDYQLHGELYATSAQGYYNSIHIVHSGDINDAAFTVAEQPVYALKVTENSQRAKNHIAAAGESFNFSITAQGGSKPVSVSVYRMEENAYKKAAIAEVLNAAEIPAGSQVSWTPSIAASAQPGIYRLEFTYYDKTEYWDFVVKAAN